AVIGYDRFLAFAETDPHVQLTSSALRVASQVPCFHAAEVRRVGTPHPARALPRPRRRACGRPYHQRSRCPGPPRSTRDAPDDRARSRPTPRVTTGRGRPPPSRAPP